MIKFNLDGKDIGEITYKYIQSLDMLNKRKLITAYALIINTFMSRYFTLQEQHGFDQSTKIIMKEYDYYEIKINGSKINESKINEPKED